MEIQFAKEFERDAHKQVRKLKSFFNGISGPLDTVAVHNFRKATRRLQGVVAACAADHASRKVKSAIGELRELRHPLSAWRDVDVVLEEVNKARKRARSGGERRCWKMVAENAAKRRRHAVKKFFRNRDALEVKVLGSMVKTLSHDVSIEGLRLLLNGSWEKWNATIDECGKSAAMDELHAVRIKAKTLRYAIELSQRFTPDHELENAAAFLKDIQNRVGIWHDQLMLAQLVLETFSESDGSPDVDAMKVIRDVKEKEISLAESARGFVMSLPKTKDYRHLKTVLSASLYAMPRSS
jgi:CHAD domain-containing protein